MVQQLHLWAFQSAIKGPSAISLMRDPFPVSPTEPLIAVSANPFRTCDACQHTVRSRFVPLALSDVCTQSSTAAHIRLSSTHCHFWSPTLEAMEHWLDSHASEPSAPPFICLLLPPTFSYLPHPENILERNRAPVFADNSLLVTDAATNDPRSSCSTLL